MFKNLIFLSYSTAITGLKVTFLCICDVRSLWKYILNIIFYSTKDALIILGAWVQPTISELYSIKHTIDDFLSLLFPCAEIFKDFLIYTPWPIRGIWLRFKITIQFSSTVIGSRCYCAHFLWPRSCHSLQGVAGTIQAPTIMKFISTSHHENPQGQTNTSILRWVI